jgi:hypothetical protein
LKRKKRIIKNGIAYKILPTDNIPKETKEKVDLNVRGIKTGEEAEKLASTGIGWGYRKTFLPGSVGILMYHGVEVALFYKRQLIEIRSDECDPVPQGNIEDPRDAWVRIEFLHCKTSMERASWFADKERELQNKITQLEGLSRQRSRT